MTTTIRTRAAAAGHLAAVAAVLAASVPAGGPRIWVGMLAFAGPLAVLATVGRHDGFVRRHALSAASFNLSVALYLGAMLAAVRLTAGSPYTVQLVPFLLFLNLIIAFNWLVFIAIGAHRAATGQDFTYPMTMRWTRSLLSTGPLRVLTPEGSS